VVKTKSLSSEQEGALKVLWKKGLSRDQQSTLREEVNNYLKIDHPHIARLLHVYEDDSRVCLVMELCRGRELYDRLKENKQFSELQTKRTVYQMLLAVAYLHNHNVVHCDLKLDNFLFETEAVNANLKLIDFGFSKNWQKHDPAMTISQGTVCYAAPEVLAGSYTAKCDIWSLGVVSFMLLGGYPPFPMHDDRGARLRIAKGIFEFKQDKFTHVSEIAKQFIRECLVVNPDERMSADECLDHNWLCRIERGHSDSCCSGLTSLSPTTLLTNCRQYNESSSMKRAALTMVAHHLNSPALARIKKLFLTMDTDKTGTITRDNFRNALSRGATATLCEDELHEIFDRIDVAHDGEITYTEFVAAMLCSKCDISGEVVLECFKLFDVSRTGRITCSDLERVLGADGYEEMDFKTLISQCTGGDVESGISLEQFDELLRGGGVPCELNDNPMRPKCKHNNRSHKRHSRRLGTSSGNCSDCFSMVVPCLARNECRK
jgi:calcium-dependent protein kinase